MSPRQRAHKTFHLLTDHLPKTPNHILLEDVREWDYGDFEGMLSKDIRVKPNNANWEIFHDGQVAPLISAWHTLLNMLSDVLVANRLKP